MNKVERFLGGYFLIALLTMGHVWIQIKLGPEEPFRSPIFEKTIEVLLVSSVWPSYWTWYLCK